MPYLDKTANESFMVLKFIHNAMLLIKIRSNRSLNDLIGLVMGVGYLLVICYGLFVAFLQPFSYFHCHSNALVLIF